MDLDNYCKKSIPRSSFCTNQSIDLDFSLNFDLLSDTKSMELMKSSFIKNSNMLTQRSLILSQYDEDAMRSTKKKVGVQLNILQKNILIETKSNLAYKTKRLNKSNFINTNAIIKMQANSYKNQPLSRKNSNTIKKLQARSIKQSQKIQNMTSADLQQIRKYDKQTYKHYLDLYNDYRKEIETQKQNDLIIAELKKQLRKEEECLQNIQSNIQQFKVLQENEKQNLTFNEIQFMKIIRQRISHV